MRYIAWIICGLLACASVCGGEIILQMAKESPELHMPDTRNQEFRLDPDGALRLSFDRASARRSEFIFPGGIPILPQQSTFDVFADIELPPDSSASTLALRIMDRHGEIFQYTSNLPRPKGVQRCRWTVDAAKPPRSHWGKTQNGIMEPPFRISGFAVEFQKGEGQGNVRFNHFGWILSQKPQASDDKPTQDSIRINLLGGLHGLGVLSSGDKNNLELIVSNRTAAPIQRELRLRFSDENGVWANKRVTCILDSGASQHIPIAVPEKLGCFTVEASCPGFFQKIRFARMEPAGNAPIRKGAFILGVNAHITRKKSHEYREKEIAAAALIGARTIRSSASMQLLWPAPGKFNFRRADEAARLLEKYHLRWDMLCAGSPRWATRTGWQPVVMPQTKGHSCPDYGLWSSYVFLVMSRYGHLIDRLEVWNEPELPGFANFTPLEYAELQKLAWRTAKGISPDVTVTTAGFTCLPGAHPKMTDPDFMPKSLELSRGSYDALAFHGHGVYTNYTQTIRGLLALRKQLNIETIPWFANETAVSAIGIGERRQAEILFQKVIFTQACGALGYLWYDMTNDGFSPVNNEHNFGLLTCDLQPKYAFCAFNTLGRHFADAQYVKDLPVFETACEGYLFQRGAMSLLPFWANAEEAQSIWGVYASRELAEYDLWGNCRPLSAESGMAVVTAERSPKFLCSPEPPTVYGVVASLRETPMVNADGTGVAVLRLNNPSAAPRELSVTYGNKPCRKFHLAPGESRETRWPFQNDDLLTFQISTTGSTAYLKSTPKKLRKLAPFSSERKPDFILNHSSQQYPTAPNDPMYQDCFWSGPSDLSARIQVGARGDLLHIRAEVTDDVHCAQKQTDKLFLGDSIQFAIQQPGTRDFWEFGVSEFGKYCWNHPGSADAALALNALHGQVTRDEKRHTTVYEISLPFTAIGMKASQPFRFNLLVNDNDGKLREGYLAIAPGLGNLKIPDKFVMLYCLP